MTATHSLKATDALEEAIAGRIDDGESIPVPTAPQADEREIAVPPGMAAKAALALALRRSRPLTEIARAEAPAALIELIDAPPGTGRT